MKSVLKICKVRREIITITWPYKNNLDGRMNKSLNKKDLWEYAEQDGVAKYWNTSR
jgi:hypothetical protein